MNTASSVTKPQARTGPLTVDDGCLVGMLPFQVAKKGFWEDC